MNSGALAALLVVAPGDNSLGGMAVSQEVAIAVAKHAVRLENLEEWQTRQNGALQRLETRIEGNYDQTTKKLDKLIWFAMTSSVGVLLTLFGGMIVLLLRR